MNKFLFLSVILLIPSGVVFQGCTSAETLPAGKGGNEVAAEVYDIVIYGGTSAGVTAAVQAANMGKSVVLLNHYPHLGGLTSGGLGRTDSGRRAVIGGLSRSFYQRVRDYYRRDEMWTHETRDEYMSHGNHLSPDDDA